MAAGSAAWRALAAPFGRTARRATPARAARCCAATVPTCSGLRCGAHRWPAGFRHQSASTLPQAKTNSYIRLKREQLWDNRKNGVWGVLYGAVALTLSVTTWDSIKEAAKLKPPKAKDVSVCWLNPNTYVGYPLSSAEDVTHDTKIFTFDLPIIDKGLGLPLVSCVMARIPKKDGDGHIVRAYTPISSNEDVGLFKLLVKRYEDGPMSEHIFSMQPGDFLQMKGPIAKFGYEPNMWLNVGMIAGGTGLTPMLQIIKESLAIPHDRTKFSLLFANKEERDILLKDELDKLAEKHPDRLQVHYTLDRPPEGWTGEKGFISKEMVEKYIAPKEEDCIVLVCGPYQMMSHVCGNKTPDLKQGEVGGILAELGYARQNVYKF